MQIRKFERNASVAWCPTCDEGIGILAAGSMAGIMDMNFSSAGILEFFELDYQNQKDMDVIPSVKMEEKLHKLAWSKEPQSEKFPLGILVGAMDSGVLNFWNPGVAMEMDGTDGNVLYSSAEKHSRPVKALDFNPIQPSLLASGGLRGEVFIWDINTIQPYAPATQRSPSDEDDITGIGWNKKIRHILASCTSKGSAVLWDLKAKKVVLNVKDPSTNSYSALAWSPDIQTMLWTASDDNHNPVIHLWDVRNVYSPVKVLKGHTAGVMSLAWSPTEPNLLLSCGKDSKTLCWDTASGDLIGELETGKGWKLDVQWCPTMRAITSTCSLDGFIEIHSVQDFKCVPDHNTGKMKLGKPPSWLGRPTSVSFAFGGKLVYVPNQTRGKPSEIQISTVVTDNEFVSRAENFQTILNEKSFQTFCESKSQSANDPNEKTVWDFLGVISAPKTLRRDKLISLLGFNRESVFQEIQRGIALIKENEAAQELEKKEKTESIESVGEVKQEKQKTDDMSELFEGDDGDLGFLSQPTITAPETKIPPLTPINFGFSDSSEVLISKALIIGNREAAVDYCFNAKRYADALVLAAFVGKSLLYPTIERYLQLQGSPFMRMVSSVLKHEFEQLVRLTELTYWKEVLAVLCTYVKGDNFGPLCEILGDRLTSTSRSSALACYICAGNVDKASDMWFSEGLSNNADLQNLIEKITILSHADDDDRDDRQKEKVTSAKLSAYFDRYVELLAAQGRLDVALHYIEYISEGAPPGSAAFEIRKRIRGETQPSEPKSQNLKFPNVTTPPQRQQDPRTSSVPQYTAPFNPTPAGPSSLPQNSRIPSRRTVGVLPPTPSTSTPQIPGPTITTQIPHGRGTNAHRNPPPPITFPPPTSSPVFTPTPAPHVQIAPPPTTNITPTKPKNLRAAPPTNHPVGSLYTTGPPTNQSGGSSYTTAGPVNVTPSFNAEPLKPPPMNTVVPSSKTRSSENVSHPPSYIADCSTILNSFVELFQLAEHLDQQKTYQKQVSDIKQVFNEELAPKLQSNSLDQLSASRLSECLNHLKQRDWAGAYKLYTTNASDSQFFTAIGTKGMTNIRRLIKLFELLQPS